MLFNGEIEDITWPREDNNFSSSVEQIFPERFEFGTSLG